MIIKSYEIQKNSENFLKYNFFLLYGENIGLKKDIKDFITSEVKQKDDTIEIISLYENEIFDMRKILTILYILDHYLVIKK